MSFVEGEITVEFGGTVGPAGPAGNAVPIAAGTVLANPSGVLANPVGVDAAGMLDLLGIEIRADQIDLRSATHRNSTGAESIGAFAQARTSAGLAAPYTVYASDLRFNTEPSGTGGAEWSLLAGNVFKFRAVGDGVADDTAEIQAALDSGEKVIIIPPSASHFRITDSLTVPAGVTVTGGGKIVQETAAKNGLILNNDCTVEGIQITGRHVVGNVSDSTLDNGIYAAGRRNITVRNCKIDGWLCGGVQVRDCFNVEISNNLFWGSTWNFADPSSGVGSDIMIYSLSLGGRCIIHGNRCHSNNSQGIGVSGSGKDSQIVVSDNICTPLHNWALPSVGTGVGGLNLLNRRHGIVVSYGGGSDSGRFSVTGNICTHTLVSGIYIASGSSVQTGIMIQGNVCKDNGYATASDATLAGGISVNGPTQGLLIHGNVIESFRGVFSTGGITINDVSSELSTCHIAGNFIKGSTSQGIAVKQDVKHVVIEHNEIRDCTVHDISLNPGANFSGEIRSNKTHRINNNYESIYVDTVSANEIVIEGNQITGVDTTANPDNNGILVRQTTTIRVRIRENCIRNFYRGIRFEATINTRELQRIKIDDNDIINCNMGVLLFSVDPGAGFVLVGLNNRFRSVTDKYPGTSGWPAFYEGLCKDETRVEIEGTGPPTSGRGIQQTWVVGDTIINSNPAVGSPMFWKCTVAGTPGTWVASANL